MNFVVVGCGRVGAELSYHLFSRGHQVVVVDINKEAFNRLHPDFRGRTIREVTQLCTRLDLRVSLIGRGMARRQSPAAGVPIQPGDECRVEFQDP